MRDKKYKEYVIYDLVSELASKYSQDVSSIDISVETINENKFLIVTRDYQSNTETILDRIAVENNNNFRLIYNLIKELETKHSTPEGLIHISA